MIFLCVTSISTFVIEATDTINVTMFMAGILTINIIDTISLSSRITYIIITMA